MTQSLLKEESISKQRSSARMSPEQFIAFATPLPEPLCLLDSSGQILAVNPAMANFLSVSSQSLTDKSLFELSADNKEKVEQRLHTWSRSRGITPGPLTIRSANNQTIPCNCYGSLIQPKGDNTAALILLRLENQAQFAKSFTALNEKIDLLQREIKERKRAASELAQRNAEFEAMFNAIPDAVMFVDTQRKIVMNNPATLEMFGYSEQELTGNTTEMLYANKADFRDQGKARYSSGPQAENGTYDVMYKHKNGTHFWTETLGTQVKDVNGETIGFIGLVRDITERRKTSHELEHHRNHLEAMVSERTAALEAANQELESFSYSVSHDLIAPLRAIDGFSHALQEDYAELIDETGQDYLERVRSGAQRMGILITDLLSLSKVSQSKLTRETIDLSAMAKTIINKLQESEPQRKVIVHIMPGLQGCADKRLLDIALTNLLSNAWKYTSRASSAQVEFGVTANNGKTVYHVRDNGAGFDMKYADKLFTAFQRLHSAEKYEGTGIGLATVARILRRHGGQIWAEAEVDKGAVFYFTLNAEQ